MLAAEREFVVAASLADDGLVERLAERLTLDAAVPVTEDVVLLDSFDARLRAAGLQVHWADGRLVLHEAGAPARHAQLPAADRYLIADLPAGALRERLVDVLEERALLPLARVRVRRRFLSSLNDDRKTVARLVVEQPSVLAPGSGAVPLGLRVRLTPVRGYDGAFARAEAAVRETLGAEEAKERLADLAIRAAGRDPSGVSSKPKLELQEGRAAAAEAGRILLRLAEIAEANVPGTLDDLDTEFLHDLRVSVRRARSVLRELKRSFAPEPLAHLRAELKWIQGLTGPVRDLDVQLLEWDELVALVPGDRVADLAPLRRLLAARRTRELAKLRRGLRSKRFAAAMHEWRAFAAAAGEPPNDGERALAVAPVEAVGGERIRHVYRRMVRDGRAIGPGSPPEALHELRKRGKELRYLLEFFGGLYPGGVVKPMVAALKDLQDVLGRYQDRAVQVEQLRDIREELAGVSGGPAALLAAGSLIDALDADARAARDEFADRFAAFASKQERSQVKRTFPKAALR